MVNDFDSRNAIVSVLDKNFIVEASAGSGKTTILVERMVALVESGVPINEIAAITFTKKAANEFYERFFKKLQLRSSDDFNILTDDKRSCLKQPTKHQQQLDLEALKKIDTCFMGTIDAFCGSIIAEHPLDIGISSCSKLLDDEYKLDQLIGMLYNASVLDEDFDDKELLEQYLAVKDKDVFIQVVKWLLNAGNLNLVFTTKDKFDELLQIYTVAFKDFKYIINELFAHNSYFSDKSTTDASKALIQFKSYKQNARLLTDDLRYIRRVQELLKVTEKFELDLNNVSDPVILDYTDEIKPKKNTFDLAFHDLEDTINELKYTITMRFVLSFMFKIHEIIRSCAILTYSTSITYLATLLRADNGRSIDVISKIREKYKYFLLDEFQDTAPIQTEIFFRINSPINERDWKKCKPIPGSLFIVGDPKQSIYHFRGADICAYKEIVDLFEQGVGTKLSLEKNFRSNSVLCDYFNKTFTALMPETNEFQNEYPKNGIPLEFTRKPKNDNFAGVYTYQADKNDEKTVAQMVLTLHEDYGYQYKDILISPLVTTKINAYKVALNDLGIPCFAEGQINFSSSKLVLTVANIFKYIITKDQYLKYELLTSDLFGFKIDEIFDTNVKEFDELIISYEDKLPSKLLETIALNPVLYDRYGVTDIDLLVALINIIKEAEINGTVSTYKSALNMVDDLLYETKTDRISLLNNDLDAVRIANVHKVKGLQSPVVILPYKKIKERKPKQLVDNKNNEIMLLYLENDDFHNKIELETHQFDNLLDKEMEYLRAEKDRLLYVAATRAEEVLIVANGYKDNDWQSIIPNDAEEFKFNERTPTINSNEVEAKTLINTKQNIVNKNHSISLAKTYTTLNASKIQSTSAKSIDYNNADYSKYNNRNSAAAKGSAVHKLMEYIVKSKGNIIDLNLLCSAIEAEFDLKGFATNLLVVGSTILRKGGFKQISSGFDSNIVSYIKKYECISELQYSYKENEILHSGIIDLLIKIESNKYIIIDYKTDKYVTTDHTAQLEEYKKAVHVLTGGTAEAYIYNIQID